MEEMSTHKNSLVKRVLFFIFIPFEAIEFFIESGT